MMKYIFFSIVTLPIFACARKYTVKDIERFKSQAKAVTIICDNWDIPHIYGKTDANAVFGLMYTQCEGNFKGIEQNYLYRFGKQTEAGTTKICIQIYSCN